MRRDGVEARIPALADLLAAAGLVERDDRVGGLRPEVGGRVVEGDVPVLADADAGEVDRRLADRRLEPRALGGRVRGVAADELEGAGRAGELREQPLAQESSERRGVVGGEPDVFVEVEAADLRPVDPVVREERLASFLELTRLQSVRIFM